MTPEELVAATSASINSLGAVYYFHPDTIAYGKEHLGLDGMRFYLFGRAGVLGNVEAPVVTSAFGYFAPGVVAKLWNSSKESVAPRDAARAALDCNAKIGREGLANVEGLAEFCEAAEQVIADVNPAGLALYAGIAAEPLPEDLPARALQLAVCHRELRGSAHLAAVVAHGVHASVAHAIRRPNDVVTFGWPEDLAITDDGAREVAARARGTPRIAGRLLRRVRDFANVDGVSEVDAKSADAALNRLEVDALGLDLMDRRYLMMIADIYKGGPVGVETLAAGLSEPRDTIEEVIEPYLIQLGLVARTARGRMLNARGWKHLGLNPPEGAEDSLFD